MIPKMNVLTTEEVRKIHDQTMKILEEVGVEFTYDPAIEVLREHGQRTEGHRVYFKRDFVEAMVAKAPAQFTLQARDPEKSVRCNHVDIIFVPSYGPPYIYEADGSRRYSLMNDYENIVKLAHVCDSMHGTGGNVCEPTDADDRSKHLEMLYRHITLSDKTFMGSAYGEIGAEDSIEMASMIFGGREALKKKPALITLINSITPLKYDDRMLAALMTYAKAGQACAISSLVMSGSTGPVTMAGTMAVQNAEVLAGIVLAQCVNPGAPVVYGSTSGAADMKTISLSIGNAENALYTAASAQLARFYGVPCRGGGGLCDAKIVDAQAAYESTLLLFAAATSGVNFVLHAAGIMQYYTAFSYEKFIVDEEICSLILKYMQGMNFSPERFLFDDIKEIGPGGHYLYQESTFRLHREELRAPLLGDRQNYEAWEAQGKTDTVARATARYQKLLAEYEKPEIDPALERELRAYVDTRAKQL